MDGRSPPPRLSPGRGHWSRRPRRQSMTRSTSQNQRERLARWVRIFLPASHASLIFLCLCAASSTSATTKKGDPIPVSVSAQILTHLNLRTRLTFPDPAVSASPPSPFPPLYSAGYVFVSDVSSRNLTCCHISFPVSDFRFFGRAWPYVWC
jgi:hypothetical protein